MAKGKGKAKAPPPAPPAASSGMHPMRPATPTAIVGLGIPSLVFGLGVAMIPIQFIAAFIIMTLSALLFCWMLWHVFPREHKFKRWIGVVVCVIAYAIIWRLVWMPAGISDPLLHAEVANYPNDTDIYGIKWRPQYSELTSVIYNGAANDLTNLDIYVKTDLIIVEAAFAPGINSCSKEAFFPGATTTPIVEKRKVERRNH